jgi:hypothetical protein
MTLTVTVTELCIIISTTLNFLHLFTAMHYIDLNKHKIVTKANRIKFGSQTAWK